MWIFFPYSRFYLIYLTLVLHGIGTLMPWNMFITAKEVREATTTLQVAHSVIYDNSCRPCPKCNPLHIKYVLVNCTK